MSLPGNAPTSGQGPGRLTAAAPFPGVRQETATPGSLRRAKDAARWLRLWHLRCDAPAPGAGAGFDSGRGLI